LVRLGLLPSTSAISLSRISTQTYPRETNGLNASIVSENKPKVQPLNKSLDVRAIIKSIPKLFHTAEKPEVVKLLENPVILRCVLLYMIYLEINRGKASVGDDLTENIKALIEGFKIKCMYDAQQGIHLTTFCSSFFTGCYVFKSTTQIKNNNDELGSD
jgi:hypothetical protein